jgi:hypothetical protein
MLRRETPPVNSADAIEPRYEDRNLSEAKSAVPIKHSVWDPVADVTTVTDGAFTFQIKGHEFRGDGSWSIKEIAAHTNRFLKIVEETK